PVHETMAALWIGTLFVVVAAGLPAVLRRDVPPDRRAPLVAEMVTRFSPLALGAAALLVLTGLTTAWVHLKYLSALWTTPYGVALITKLCVVAIVVALGAWNWRRMTPRLGTEESAHALRRSATSELAVAAVVLVVTAVLVSLPTPKLPPR
ncbi:MAG TPA: CopD family protein, partial [Gemmatimonadaceae bacterium]|nr:CopD family protein [Gemmatimonadaceae bacterium]